MDFTKGDLAKSNLSLSNNHSGFLCHMTFYILHLMYLSEDKCGFKIENLAASYKLPKDYIIKVFCIIILCLQSFQILKWRIAANLSPLYKI